jgi:hypothetical protein
LFLFLFFFHSQIFISFRVNVRWPFIKPQQFSMEFFIASKSKKIIIKTQNFFNLIWSLCLLSFITTFVILNWPGFCGRFIYWWL